MKFNKKFFPLILICFSMALPLNSCYVGKEPERLGIKSEDIAIQVKDAIYNEAQLMQLTDTLHMASDSAAVMTKKQQPIVIDNLKVIVSDDSYSIAQQRYNERLKMGQRFALSIIFIIIPVSFILVLTIGVLVFQLKKNNAKNRIIEEAIKNGYQLPDSFYNNSEMFTFGSGRNKAGKDSLTTPPPANRDQRLFSQGISWLLTGIGLFIAFLIWGGMDLAAFGLIPIFIGIGKLIAYYR